MGQNQRFTLGHAKLERPSSSEMLRSLYEPGLDHEEWVRQYILGLTFKELQDL